MSVFRIPNYALVAFSTAYLLGNIQCPVAHADELTSGMAKLSYLMGEWTCKTSGSAGPNGVVITFTPSAENRLHEHVKAEQYESDAYFGYSPTLNSYYMVYAESGGFYGFIMSTDGHHFSGTARAGGARTMNEVMAFNTISPNQLSISRKDVDDNIPVNGEAICTRYHDN